MSCQQSLTTQESSRIRHICVLWVAAVLLFVVAGTSGCRRPVLSVEGPEGGTDRHAGRIAELKTLGRLHLEAGRYNDAYVAFSHAAEHADNDFEIAWGMARANSKLRNDVQALDWLNTALRIIPNSADAMELKGRTLLRLGRVQDAITVLERTVELHPDHTLAWLNLSAAYDTARQFDKAIDSARAATKTDRDASTPHFALGDIYLKREQLADAEEQYRLAVSKDPGHALSYLRLASLYIRQEKDLDQARAWALRSEQIDPGDGTAASAAAWVLFLQDRKQEAVSEMAKAAEAHPQNYQIWMRLGTILDDLGDTKKAQEAFETAARFAPRIPSTEAPSGSQGVSEGAE